MVQTEEGEIEAKGALPGQTVSVRVKKTAKGRAKGILNEVMQRSPRENLAAVCPHFGICGGCQMLGREIVDPGGIEGDPGARGPGAKGSGRVRVAGGRSGRVREASGVSFSTAVNTVRTALFTRKIITARS